MSSAWNRHFNLVVLLVVVVGLAVGAAAASFFTKPPPAVVAQAASGSGATGQGGAGSGQAAAGQAATAIGGRGVSGTVGSVDANTITVSGQQGDTKVSLSGARIVKTADGAASDLQSGQRVTVVGQMEADGSYTASTVQIVPADQAQRGGGFGQTGSGAGQGGAGASTQGGNGSAQASGATTGQGGANRGQGQPAGGGAGARPLNGSVTSVDNGVLTMSAQQGDVKVKLAGAKIEKTVDGTAKDLQTGQGVVVTGQAGADGTFAATEVQITAAGDTPAQSGQRPSSQQTPAPTSGSGR